MSSRESRDERSGLLEASGQNFLSPSLATADLMRRVLDPGPFADWLYRALPQIPRVGRQLWSSSSRAAPGVAARR